MVVNTKRTVDVVNNYNKSSYKIGTRITRAHIARRVGYYDKKTGIMFYERVNNYDTWICSVNQVRKELNCSPQEAAKYVNSLYQGKMKVKGVTLARLNAFIMNLRNICGKWFSVVPTMQSV
jgi:hypothetical protein